MPKKSKNMLGASTLGALNFGFPEVFGGFGPQIRILRQKLYRFHPRNPGKKVLRRFEKGIFDDFFRKFRPDR